MTISTIDRISNARVHSLHFSLALAALISAILLVLVGSIVRVTGHGLGVPGLAIVLWSGNSPGFYWGLGGV